MSSWYSDTVSLGSATGTKIDSGCKHIVTCRVDTSTLQELCAVATDLATNHNKYSLKQGDIVLATGNTWCDTDITRREDAYPLVISNLGDMKELSQKVMKFVYHNASSVYDRDQMLKAFRGDARSRVRFDQGDYFQVNADGSVKNPHEYRNALKQIRDCLGMGVALTEAPAIGTKGDTAASVMIGGMITVTNGAFKMRTGDLVQVYWEFERDCFYKDGKRKGMAAARLEDQTDIDSNVIFTNTDMQAIGEEWDNTNDEKARRDFALRGTAPYRQRRIIALVKPYIEDEEQPRLYDRLRVIGRANHDAGPGQAVDVKLSTQSL